MEQYRKTPRARFLDYDSGDYFITICTKGRKHYFGEIKDSEMIRSAIGDFVNAQLEKCSEFCRSISIPVFVVMPNHIHFIVSLTGVVAANGYEQRSPNAALRANPTSQRHVPALSKYITSLKGAVTKHAKMLNLEFGWQSRYHDHLIRGSEDGNRISEYIINNVAKWHQDCFNEE
ncbi:MAG: transposase [[Clostridium] fimetarium]|nr:transposase [Alistipes timonensis]MCM1405143.1 transposase [[Clostridium] fimetarium]